MEIKEKMIILGVDQGIANLGYSLILFNTIKEEIEEVLETGILKTTNMRAVGDRVLTLKNNLQEIIKKYKIDLICTEKLFGGKIRTVEMITGMLYVLSGELKTPILIIAPNSVKKIVTGDGRADKIKVQKHLREKYLKDIKFKADHQSDSFAIAIATILRIKENKKFLKEYLEQLHKIKRGLRNE